MEIGAQKPFSLPSKPEKRKITIHELVNDQGTSLTEERDKAEWARQFFENLLQKTPDGHGEQRATEDILTLCKTRVSETHRQQLNKEYTLEELHKAASEFGKNKAPGPDALPLEFFLLFCDTVAPALLRLAEEGLHESRLPKYFTAGDIVLIPKEGDQTQLQNKCPITLLNAAYKIVAKLLQNRMAPILQDIISWKQNAFMQGGKLHAIVFLCNQAVWEAKQEQIDCTLLKVDFRKAFDSISWEFLFRQWEKCSLTMQWNKSLATWISTAQRPIWTEQLGWKWTLDHEEHKMLGFIFTDAMDQEAIFQKCIDRIEKVLNNKKLTSQSLQGRVTIANHIIYGFIWFILPLWVGKMSHLQLIDKKVVRFVWEGGRGANMTPRQCITHKVLSFLNHREDWDSSQQNNRRHPSLPATVTWAFTPGLPHPLKQIICAAFAYDAERKCGAPIEAAVLHTGR
ncbi:hypothetical protein R1sor_006542 [Riccia sorocarpa]|uniref:Reverse transcriptase domain-containing protein n=1 Tax=Riccia sorocarpa TaxID=122646 RepID=A0ABD3HRZ0_9MARC